jgi:hypothetical protein
MYAEVKGSLVFTSETFEVSMKIPGLIIFFVLIPLLSFSQFTVNAGRDTALCLPYNIVQLGGNPSASGGIEPYSFTWECSFYENGYWHYANFFLDNTHSPNPFLKQLMEPINGKIRFKLKVTDNSLNTKTDTANVTISSIATMHTADPGSTINQGDSVKLDIINVYNGIPPFNYLWTPSIGLSDPILRNPYAKPLITTHYTVRVTDSIGCINNDYFHVTVLMTDIDNLKEPENSRVFPNPINGNSVISLFESTPGPLIIYVSDLNGRQVLKDSFNQNYKIGEKIKNTGVYFYQVWRDKSVCATGRFIRNK